MTDERFNQMVSEHMLLLKDHELKVASIGNVAAFRMQSADGVLAMSTDLIFGLDRIWIGGDFSPLRHGVVSSIGYSLSWFVDVSNDAGYLGEKFLEEGWSELRCRDDIGDYIEQEEAEIADLMSDIESDEASEEDASDSITVAREDLSFHRDCVSGLRRAADAAHMGIAAVYEELPEFYRYDPPGYGFDYDQLAILCAIQRTFSRLYCSA